MSKMVKFSLRPHLDRGQIAVLGQSGLLWDILKIGPILEPRQPQCILFVLHSCASQPEVFSWRVFIYLTLFKAMCWVNWIIWGLFKNSFLRCWQPLEWVDTSMTTSQGRGLGRYGLYWGPSIPVSVWKHISSFVSYFWRGQNTFLFLFYYHRQVI